MNKYIDAELLMTFLKKKLESYKSKMVDPSKYPIDHIDLMAFLASEYQALILQIEHLQQEQPEVDDIEFRCGYFSGPIFPAWIDAPSTLQPAHKYHGLEVVACHLKEGGYRVVPRNEPVSFELPEGTHLVGGWKEKAPED